MAGNSGLKALKSGVWYTVANFVAKGAGFLTTPIFTRLLTSGEIGDFSNFVSWIGILGIVATFELSGTIGLARYDYRNELDDYMASVLLLGSMITLGFYLLCLIFKNKVLAFLGFSELELHAAFVYLIFYPALLMFQGKKQIMYEYKASVAISTASMLSAVLFSLILVLLCENKLVGRIMGHYGTMTVLNVAVYLYLLLKTKKIKVKYWGYALKLSAPMIVHMLAGNLLNSSDRIMIRNICGTSDVAMYSVAYTCAMVVQVLWQSMNSAWAPWAYEMMDSENYRAMRKAVKPYVISFGLIAFAFMIVGPEVLWVMGGKAYMEALAVIPPVLCAYVFQFVYSLFVNIEFFYKKQHYIAIGTIIASFTNIVLNSVFIPVFGYVAAAYTTLAGYILLFLVHYLFTVRMGKNSIYSARFIFTFLGCALLMTGLGIILYQFTLIRYALIAIAFFLVASLIVLLRKELMELVKNRSTVGIKKRIRQLRMQQIGNNEKIEG